MTTALLLVSLATAGVDYSVALIPGEGGGPSSTALKQDAPSLGSGVVAPPKSAAPESSTTVCRCQGFRESVCLCLKAGQKCHCSRTSGSVWATDKQGRATHKTGAKADPRIGGGRPEPVSHSTTPGGFEVTLRRDGKWWWHDGDLWRWTRQQPTEGQRFSSGGKAFIYRDGRMQAEMVLSLAPKGHWEKRCYGTFCRMEFVED